MSISAPAAEDREDAAMSAEWNYDMTQAPTDGTEIIGLWRLHNPDRFLVKVTWLAKRPNSGFRYLAGDRWKDAHYVQDPIAFFLIPKP